MRLSQFQFPRRRLLLTAIAIPFAQRWQQVSDQNQASVSRSCDRNQHLTLFLCGDVMLGRGIDQVLPHPNRSTLHEPYVKDAKAYIELAQKTNGPFLYPVSFSYIWGDALEEWQRINPDLRLINLETSITSSNNFWPNKSIHYRLHPANITCLTTAQVDYCALANNHVLDWSHSGLTETLATLKQANIQRSGSGQTLSEAAAPAVIKIANKGKVIIFSMGVASSGIPISWAATPHKPGVYLLQDLSTATIHQLEENIRQIKTPDSVVIVSIHWGSNWNFEIPQSQRDFAHQLIDQAAVDLIYGHSSHHIKGIEVYHEKLILYGCGDFLNDYEGISGHETFRGDLGLMYFPTIERSTGKLISLRMTPTQIKQFQIKRASSSDAMWLKETLNREGKPLGTQTRLTKKHTLSLQWH